jgi:zona occludens toxin
MSIKVYTGRMGSGKSYEVVTVVILGALKLGRRVVSNIAGLNFDEMRRVLLEQGIEENQLGSIVQIEHDKVTDRGFWLTDENPDAFIQAGDLLVLDEVWRFYDGFGNAVPEAVMNFFRMHRHFTHPGTGQTCDVALITQSISDIGRKIRPVVEETYHMEKLTLLGSSRHYRVDVFAGAKGYRDLPVRSIQRAYKPEYFAFYKSHSQKSDDGADAKELNIDDRGNIFKSNFFRVVVPLAVLVLVASIWYVTSFFRAPSPKKPGLDSSSASTSALSSVLPDVPRFRSSVDRLSRLLASNRARLAFAGEIGGRRIAKVEFLAADGSVADAYSEDALFLNGWRLFFGADGRSAILSDGNDFFVISVEVRHRLPRMNGGQ